MRINPIFVMSKGNNNNLKIKDYESNGNINKENSFRRNGY